MQRQGQGDWHLPELTCIQIGRESCLQTGKGSTLDTQAVLLRKTSGAYKVLDRGRELGVFLSPASYLASTFMLESLGGVPLTHVRWQAQQASSITVRQKGVKGQETSLLISM